MKSQQGEWRDASCQDKPPSSQKPTTRWGKLALPMRAAVFVVGILISSIAHADPPSQQRFVLYKFQNRIGVEESIDDGREIRTVFSFTDRSTPVPLASVFERGKDGTPVRFQLWGQ